MHTNYHSWHSFSICRLALYLCHALENNLSPCHPELILRLKANGRLVVELQAGQINVRPKETTAELEMGALWGLYRSLVANMIKDVTDGFNSVLLLQGVGYRATTKGSDLELSLGFSHPILIKAPTGITFAVDKNRLTVTGIDKELVGQIAASIRSKRKPEPYKGSGVRYENEVIIKKAGKKAAATTA